MKYKNKISKHLLPELNNLLLKMLLLLMADYLLLQE